MSMRAKSKVLIVLGCAAAALFATSAVAATQKVGAAALAGRVSSDAEGAMEGVLVRAKGEGKTISVTVVSDHEGRYSFPASRLARVYPVGRLDYASEFTLYSIELQQLWETEREGLVIGGRWQSGHVNTRGVGSSVCALK